MPHSLNLIYLLTILYCMHKIKIRRTELLTLQEILQESETVLPREKSEGAS